MLEKTLKVNKIGIKLGTDENKQTDKQTKSVEMS